MGNRKFTLLSIIIVNWNAGRQLRDCLSSIAFAKQERFTLSEVIIVDNCSTDGSLEGIDSLGITVSVIRNNENRGFGYACNQGASEATGDYLLFLNPDTRLFDDSLTRPIDFMQKKEHSAIGICGIRLVDDEGNASTSAARFPTLRVMAGESLGLNKLFPDVFSEHLVSFSDLPGGGFVDQVIGAFFLVRKNVFDHCSGFDERFFVYFEEVDLSLRAKQLGYSSYLLSNASAFHKGGGCSEQVKAARLFYSLRSRILYAQKHYSLIEYITLILLTVIELPLRLIQGMLRASWSDFKNTITAYMQLVSYFYWRD
jgi:GT2 family glycosyltransferase